MVEPLEGQGQMGPPLVAGQGVYLVDDHRVHTTEERPGRGGGQQQVQGLRSGHQQVGRRPAHGHPFGGRRVAGPDGHRQLGGGQATALRLLGDAGQRQLQVLVDVGGQSPEGRHVDHPGAGCGWWRGRTRRRPPGRRRRSPPRSRSGSCRCRWARPPARPLPRRSGGQAARCGSVGPEGKRPRNQPATAGWNVRRMESTGRSPRSASGNPDLSTAGEGAASGAGSPTAGAGPPGGRCRPDGSAKWWPRVD